MVYRENMDPHPLSFLTVGGFICSHVKRLRGSAKSIINLVSALHTYSTLSQLDWFTIKDQYLVKTLVGQLQLQDTTLGRKRRPATLAVMALVDVHLPSTQEAQLFQLMCYIAHDGLLRSAELCSGLLVSDITWDFSNYTAGIRLFRTKTHRAGNSIEVLLKKRKGICGYNLLLTWMHKQKLWHRPRQHLFPHIDKRRKVVNYHKSITYRKWLWTIKFYYAKLGLTGYTGHSYRAGGATDLLANGVSIQDVQKFGRWKSNAVLVYYKAEPLQIASKIGKGFARNAKMNRKGLRAQLKGHGGVVVG